MLLYNPISTEILPLAGFAAMTLPNAVEVVGSGIHQPEFVSENTRLEVAIVFH